MDIVRNINAMAKDNALAAALLSPEGYMPFGELAERISVVSNYFSLRQLPRQSRVFVNIADHDLRFIVIVSALNYGLVPLVLSSISALSQKIECDFVIGGSQPLDPELRPDLVIDETVLDGKLADKTAIEYVPREPEELLFIAATSGTTGEKKLIANTIGLMNRREGTGRKRHFRPGERVMSTIGGATPYNFMTMVRVVASKACFVRPHPDTGRCLKMINAYQVETIISTPAKLQQYMDVMEHNNIRCPSVQQVNVTGSLFPKELISRLETFFDATFHVSYGTSETGGIASDQVDSGTFELGYVGKIRPGISLVYNGAESGEPSELVIVNEPAILSNRYVGGKVISNDTKLYRLPDLGFVRGNRLYLVGRDDEVYNFSGNKIAFSRIEEAIRQQATVTDVAIVAALPEVDPEGLIIVIVLQQALDLETLRDDICRHFNLQLARDHVRVLRVDGIPRDESGKINRSKVRQLVDEGDEQPARS